MDRVACYIRVSTEEQKIHGISLDAQRDKLQEYADKNELKIVGWYEDEGVSGRKLIAKRPQLQRMLNDAQAGKFDRIIFIKLDRFFRSVAEYHECMKKIDPVVWTATEEKYDLTTANGRAFVNMKLTIAELEADQTGERIKIVNDYKIKNGQPVTGALGIAFKIEKDQNGVKRVVINKDNEVMVRDLLHYFLLYQNKAATVRYIYFKYNVALHSKTLTRLFGDTKLYGSFRGNDNYCPAYIDKATFDRIQYALSKNAKKTPSKRVYLFSGLMKCPICGSYLSITRNTKNYYSYKCAKYVTYKTCTYSQRRGEPVIERQLLNIFDSLVKDHITNVTIQDNRANADNEVIERRISALNTEMTKIKRMYRKGDMTEVEYDHDMNELKSELQDLNSRLEPVKERDLTIYQELLNSDWKSLYNALNRENKKAFWRKFIKEIIVDTQGNIVDLLFF